MANKLDPMDIKQILVLIKDGFSNRKIGATLGISRNTVNNYAQQFNSSGFSIGELLNFDEIRLNELFTSKTTIDTNRHDDLMRYFERINAARNHPGFTFQYHYNEYVSNASNPYSYTQFMEHYHRKYARIKGSLKLEHLAGHEMFVDFAGKKLEIVDKDTGEIKPVEVFVSILPCSQYTYVEACNSQNRNDFISCCINALHFYGGVPKAIVSDNLKSAVTRASKYEPIINRSFKDFANHYGCVINPTRVYAPQDKALVENAVHLTYQRIYYPLREITFFSIEELNREIRRLLSEYNKLLFKRKEASRLELFQTIEREYLKSLPAQGYQIKDYRRAKVQKMGYVYFSPDKSYYSVPYRYIGKQTQIHYTQSNLDKNMFTRLATLGFIKRKENIIITGASGTGKSYLAQALGYQACLMEYKTLYANTTKLISRLKLSKIDGTYLKELSKLKRMDILILDDFGLHAFDNQAREILLDIIDERHNMTSTILSSQIPVSAWYDLIGEQTIADAVLDRIVNSSHRIILKGESLRKGKLSMNK